MSEEMKSSKQQVPSSKNPNWEQLARRHCETALEYTQAAQTFCEPIPDIFGYSDRDIEGYELLCAAEVLLMKAVKKYAAERPNSVVEEEKS